MKAVLQRAQSASVMVSGQVVGSFVGEGLVALIGVTHSDGPSQAITKARKLADLRIIRAERSLPDATAPVWVISQFTLYGDPKKGRRPTWHAAAPGPVAKPLIDQVIELLRQRGLTVTGGVFGADMAVSLTNDGPFTVIVEV
jgi:D-tyrosyl-tRNA(Tyr) deacylase